MEDTRDICGKILGTNTRCYPRQSWELTDGNSVEVSVVLVAGAIGDYAAYVGAGEPEWVAAHGNKISFEEACVHFPGGQLEDTRYRQ